MNKLKVMSKNILPSSIFLLLSLLFLSIFSYFNILGGTPLIVAEILICFITVFIGSYKQGKSSTKRGYLEGMSIGGIYIFLFVLINLIVYRLFHLKNIIYYLLILIISALGGMTGISRKKNN